MDENEVYLHLDSCDEIGGTSCTFHSCSLHLDYSDGPVVAIHFILVLYVWIRVMVQ